MRYVSNVKDVKYQKRKQTQITVYDANTISLHCSAFAKPTFNPIISDFRMNIIDHNNVPVQSFIDQNPDLTCLLTAIHMAVHSKEEIHLMSIMRTEIEETTKAVMKRRTDMENMKNKMLNSDDESIFAKMAEGLDANKLTPSDWQIIDFDGCLSNSI